MRGSEKNIVMMDECCCFWINASQWCAWKKIHQRCILKSFFVGGETFEFKPFKPHAARTHAPSLSTHRTWLRRHNDLSSLRFSSSHCPLWTEGSPSQRSAAASLRGLEGWHRRQRSRPRTACGHRAVHYATTRTRQPSCRCAMQVGRKAHARFAELL